MQIETKYNIWDTVWTIENSKAVEIKIKKIIAEEYVLSNPYYNIELDVYYFDESWKKYHPWKIRKTKEELLELL